MPRVDFHSGKGLNINCLTCFQTLDVKRASKDIMSERFNTERKRLGGFASHDYDGEICTVVYHFVEWISDFSGEREKNGVVDTAQICIVDAQLQQQQQ